jgi:peptide/nickel transport system permease protein
LAKPTRLSDAITLAFPSMASSAAPAQGTSYPGYFWSAVGAINYQFYIDHRMAKGDKSELIQNPSDFTTVVQAYIIWGLGIYRMWAYTGRRLLSIIPVLFGISLLVFLFLHLIPGDPAVVLLGERARPEQIEALREKLGLNQPLYTQYFLFLRDLVQGNLGSSIFNLLPVRDQLAGRWPATFELALAAMLVAVALGIPLGILAAVRKNSLVDNSSTIFSLVGVSMPVFWLGLILIYLFAVNLQWLPPSGRIGIDAGNNFKTISGFFILDSILQGRSFGEVVSHLILPALTLGTIPLAILTRITRSAMLEVLSQDYVRTARAKGLNERVVVWRHALKNALLPVVTIIGLQFGTLLGGAILTETIFSWPGIGSWIYEGILNRDYPVVQGGVIFVALVFVLVNLIVDLSYALLDPRIQYR